MAHAMMDHGDMDHGDMGHGDMNLNMCKMNMLFTWETHNVCVIFHWWQIRSSFSLVLTLLGVVALVAGYEALREATRRYESHVSRKGADLPRRDAVEVSKRAHVVKAFLYALQSFYAFMIMLLFMTYNGWIMLAVAVGAFVGYLFFGSTTSATKDNACH